MNNIFQKRKTLLTNKKKHFYKFLEKLRTILILFENYGFSYFTLKEKRGQEVAISIPVWYNYKQG